MSASRTRTDAVRSPNLSTIESKCSGIVCSSRGGCSGSAIGFQWDGGRGGGWRESIPREDPDCVMPSRESGTEVLLDSVQHAPHGSQISTS